MSINSGSSTGGAPTIPYTQTGTLNLNQILVYDSTIQAFINGTLPAGGNTGEINTASNLGAGTQVFKDKLLGDLRFKSVIAGFGINITSDADEIFIATTALGTGDITGGLNTGTGSQVFRDKSGQNLRFRTLTAGANITITPNVDDITITASTNAATLNSLADTAYVKVANNLSDVTAATARTNLSVLSTAQGDAKYIKVDTSSMPAVDATTSIGDSTHRLNDVYAVRFRGEADTAITAVNVSGFTPANYATIVYVNAQIADTIEAAPGALDTLNELAAALGDDANFSTTMTNALAGKLVKANNLSDVANAGIARTNLGISNTTTISEGTNLYFTTARAKAATVADAIANAVVDVAPSQNAVFDALALKEGTVTAGTTAQYYKGNKTWATLNTTAVVEGTNLYFTTARTNTAFDTRLAAKSTTNVTEGTNLYYTNTRADARIVAASANWNTAFGWGNHASAGYITATLTDEQVEDKIGAMLTGNTETLITVTYQDSTGDIDFVVDNNLANYSNASSGFLTSIAANSINDTHIDWGTGSNQVSTADVPEQTNLYYTDARANSAFDTRLATKTTANLAENTNLYFTNARADARADLRVTAGFLSNSTTNLSEGTNLYYTNARADARVNAVYSAFNTDFDTRLAAKTTANLTEGTNLYFTTARAKAATVADAIANSVTDVAPSQNAVYDALIGKEPTLFTGAAQQYYRGTKTWETLNTTAVVEGSNLYHTNARADARITAATGVSVQAYDADLTAIAGLAKTDSNFIVGNGTAWVAENAATARASLGLGTAAITASTAYLAAGTLTTGVAEGTNLYYTNARARAAISENSTQLAYNSTTGVLTFTQGNTSTVAEGTNLYYTNARADARITNAGVTGTTVGNWNTAFGYGNHAGAGYALTSYVDTAIAGVLDSAPGALNTLNELAAALGDDANFAATMTNSLAGKEPTITAGTTAKYWRGDKSFQTLDTSVVAENTNLYFTNARARAAISESSTQLAYNNSTGVLTFTQGNTSTVAEGGNLYYTNARADARIGAAAISALSDVHTAAPTNGQVLKWVNANSRWEPAADTGGIALTALSVATGSASGSGVLSYNNGTGVFTFQPADLSSYLTSIAANSINDTHIDWGTGANQVSTADIPESTKLYYTDARADARIGAASINALTDVTITSAASGDILKHNGAAWVDVALSTTEVPEGTNLYYTDVRADARITNVLIDEDNMATNSATRLPTQQSVKAYVDAQAHYSSFNTDFDTRLAAKSTTHLGEGTNLYYTTARADARIAAASLSSLSNVHNAAATDGQVLKWVNANSRWEPGSDTGHSSTSTLSEGTNLYYTDARFDTRLTAKSTTNLSEGTNLYFTNARADARIAAASISALTDVNITGIANGKILKYDAGTSKWIIADDLTSGGGGTTFVSHADTPASYSGSGGYFVKVNSGATALEFVATGGGSGDITAVVAGTGLTGGATSGSATLNVDVGTAAGKIVQLDGSARLPAVVGSLLTGIVTTNVGEGTNLYYTNARADARIVNAGSANWNTAFGWGNHVSASYLTSTGLLASHTDVHTAAPTNGQVLKWDNGNSRWAPATDSGGIALTDLSVTTAAAGTAALAYNNGTGVFTFTPPNLSSYLTSVGGLTGHTDVDAVVAGDDAKVLYYNHATTSFKWKVDGGHASTSTLAEGTNLYYTNARADARITNAGSANWNTAFGWGNHASGGYLTSIAVNSINDTHIDWGTGTNQVSTADIPESTKLYYTDARADARAQLKIDALVASAPGALDTLNELAAAIGDDANFATTMTNSLAGKEPTITAGTTAQYYKGNKSWATLDTAAVAESTNLYYTNARADARIVAAGSANWNTAFGWGDHGAAGYLTATLTDEQVEDKIGAMLTGNTETLITVTYQDSTGDIDFVVDNNLANYSNASSGFLTSIAVNSINDTHIDWGTGTNQVSTADIPESTKLYYTDARADARIVAAGSANWNTAYTHSQAAHYATSNHNTDFDTRLATKTTANLAEGANLYYTDVRADARIVNAGSANWNTAYGWGNHGAAGYLTSTGAITSHTDVHTAAPTDGQILAWVNANSRYEPTTVGGTGTVTSIIAGTGLTGGTITTTGTVAVDVSYIDGRVTAGSINNLVEDITPQLGGDLDGNSKAVTNVKRLEIVDSAHTGSSLDISNGTVSTGVQKTYVLHGTTNNNTQTEIFIGAQASTRMAVASPNACWMFEIDIMAIKSGAAGEQAGWKYTGMILNNAGTTAFTSNLGEIEVDPQANWSVAVEADNTNDALVIKVTGENSKTIRWVAFVKTTQMS